MGTNERIDEPVFVDGSLVVKSGADEHIHITKEERLMRYDIFLCNRLVTKYSSPSPCNCQANCENIKKINYESKHNIKKNLNNYLFFIKGIQ